MAKRVSLFVTCLVDQSLPRIGLAAATVLERIGYTVDFPSAQTCCGQPALEAGFRPAAQAAARHFLATFADAEAIVIPSGRCAATILNHYADLCRGDEALLRQCHLLAPRLFEFSRFLVEVAQITDVGARFAHRVAYQRSCQAGQHNAAEALLRNVKGLELLTLPGTDECCGAGGQVPIQFPDLARTMARGYAARVRQSGATHLVGLDAACLQHLAAGLAPLETLHLAEVLACR